jgi:hypothetical protein
MLQCSVVCFAQAKFCYLSKVLCRGNIFSQEVFARPRNNCLGQKDLALVKFISRRRQILTAGVKFSSVFGRRCREARTGLLTGFLYQNLIKGRVRRSDGLNRQ